MGRTRTILVLAAIILGSAAAAFAGPGVPTEQQRYYDRNAGY
jgi:hypothetical protein